MVCVDWCDARAYCAGVRKRLCGKIGRGTNATTDYANAATSEWYRACSSSGVNAYPYGNTRDASACNGYDHGNGIIATRTAVRRPRRRSTTSAFAVARLDRGSRREAMTIVF